MNALQRKIVSDYQAAAGAHDEPWIYAEPAGDPGLLGPDSVSWDIHSDLGVIAIAGTAAIIMEILHPSVMAGVHEQSSYREDPFRRSKTTAQYVIATTFGSAPAAEKLIARVRRMHERVNGTRPDGEEYHAMDPELIGWVHTCIPWALMTAYERYNRPLSTQEKDRYLAEQAVIGRKGGAGPIPETCAELEEYVEAMRPSLAVNEQTRTFFDFLMDSPFGPSLPRPLARANNLFGVHGSMSLMPRWARALTGFDHSDRAQRLLYDPNLRVTAGLIRWSFGTPVFREMAEKRVAGARLADSESLPPAPTGARLRLA